MGTDFHSVSSAIILRLPVPFPFRIRPLSQLRRTVDTVACWPTTRFDLLRRCISHTYLGAHKVNYHGQDVRIRFQRLHHRFERQQTHRANRLIIPFRFVRFTLANRLFAGTVL